MVEYKPQRKKISNYHAFDAGTLLMLVDMSDQ